MYCTRCGVQLDDKANFCADCGAPTARAATTTSANVCPRLSRPVYGRKVAGVCAGFARYFGVDVTLVRILWLVLIFWPLPIGIIGYIVAWIVMPTEPLAVTDGSGKVTVATPHTVSGRA